MCTITLVGMYVRTSLGGGYVCTYPGGARMYAIMLDGSMLVMMLVAIYVRMSVRKCKYLTRYRYIVRCIVR